MKKQLGIITLSLCMMLSACGTSSTSVSEGNDNASTELSASFEMDSVSVYDNAMEEGSAAPKEISVQTTEDSVGSTEESLVTEVASVQTTEDSAGLSAETLMTEFMNGGLEGCLFNDGSEASEHFRAWSEMLGGEEISLETETPQIYWESWCAHVENLYAGNGYDFFIEQDYPISAKYIELKYNDGY